MNGIQPASIRVCKRIRCLPTCLLGTRDIILSRRLAQERIRRYHTPNGLGPTSNQGSISISHNTNFRAQRGDEAVQPNSRTAIPLNSEITKLTPLSVSSREGPIRRLLQAINRRQDVILWRYFSYLASIHMTPRLSAADYSSILLSLRPHRYVSRHARHYLNESNEVRLIIKERSYEEFRRRLQDVSMAMQAHGHSLSVLEYTHLLDCAAACRNTEMARQLWNQMTIHDRITPDIWAYNSYMAAMCGTGTTNREFRAERILSQSTSSKNNVRDAALTIYKQIIDRGLAPNAMTFDILMLAVARMGDLASVCRTLKEAWGVDVDTLDAPETPETMRPLVARDSPLHPSIHTLTSVAIAFGSNNNIETAIRVVDHLSRRYQIPIPVSTWVALLNWIFVFTRRPPASLPKYSLINLWRIMTAEPYRVNPTIEMYDYLVRSFISRKMLPDAEAMINRGLKVFSYQKLRTSSAAAALEAALETSPRNNTSYNKLFELRRGLAIARREEFRSRSTIRRWVELLCLGKNMRAYHARIRVPNVVRKMRYFLGEQLNYVTPSGYVNLKLGGEWRAMSIRRRKRPWTPLGTGTKEMDYLD